MRADPQTLTVIGAGSWGTALAIQLARTGQRTVLWGRDRSHVAELDRDRRNLRYLPDAEFPPALVPEPQLAEALEGVRDVLLAVPSHAFRSTLEDLAPRLAPEARVAWASKGIELESGKLLHEVAAEVIGRERPTAVLSGPTFAREVGAGLPTAMTIASSDAGYANELAERISSANFRAYTSADIAGVEIGGAVKNPLAIGAGISDGLGFGSNTRVALITRGLVEMTRLGCALGARTETFIGLAGIGDLVLTCTDDQSRNRRFGLLLAAGKTAADAQREIAQVVEGVQAARAVWQLAQRLDVEMPIIEQIHAVLYADVTPRAAVQDLMGRALKPEHE